MVVLDQFYQLVESRTSRVSSWWKACHIAAFVVAAVCGFLTSFTFGRVLDDFNYNCILNADLEFDNSTFLNLTDPGVKTRTVRAIQTDFEFDNLTHLNATNDNSTYLNTTEPSLKPTTDNLTHSNTTDSGVKPRTVQALDLSLTMWGPMSDCNFAQFIPLVMMISALVWGTYFAIMSRGGAGYQTDLLAKPWAIMYPCIIFSFIFFVIYVVSTRKLSDGMRKFCRQFKPQFNNTRCVRDINVYITQFHDSDRPDIAFYDFYQNISTAIASSEIGIWAWVFQLVLCVVRICCVTDFDMQLVTVITKTEEELEKVVELSSDLDEEV